MSAVRIARINDVELEFDGRIVGESSSEGDKPRWQEVRIYRVAGDPPRWVVEQAGRSRLPSDRQSGSHARVCATPDEVREALRTTQDGRTFMTRVSMEALKAAVAADPALAGAMVERL